MQLSTAKPAIETATAHVLVIAGLVLLSVLTVYRSFGEFGFYYDDWRYLQEAVQGGGLQTAFPARPLHRPLTEWVFNTIGFSPATGYVLLTALLIASALAMYWMMNVLFPRRRAFAVIATVIYLLYPGDLSRTWISAGLTANRPAVLLALVSLGLLFSGLRLRKRHPRRFRALFAASLSVYLLSLMLYEAQATLVPALAFAGTVRIGVTGRGLTYRSGAGKTALDAARICAPFAAILIAVILWRLVITQAGAEDRFTATANYSPLYLARQLAGVYYFNYLEQPAEVVLEAVPFLGKMSIVLMAATVMGALLIVVPVMRFGRRAGSIRAAADTPSEPHAESEVRLYRVLLISSLILTGIVYAVLLPHDHIISASGLEGPFVSRLNAAGAVVVAIATAAAVMFGWTWLIARWRSRRSRIDRLVGAGIAASIVLLVSFHAIVQRDYAEAWKLQRSYAQQVFDALPEVAPDTHLHFSGVPSRHGSSYVFTYSLEHMLRVAYGDETLTATSGPAMGDRSVLNQKGLYLDGEFVAPAGRVWHFELVADGCDGNSDPGCGRLVLSAPALTDRSVVKAVPSDRISSASTAAVRDLLGIEAQSSVSQADQDQPSPIRLSAPSEPPSDSPGN